MVELMYKVLSKTIYFPPSLSLPFLPFLLTQGTPGDPSAAGLPGEPGPPVRPPQCYWLSQRYTAEFSPQGQIGASGATGPQGPPGPPVSLYRHSFSACSHLILVTGLLPSFI